MERRHFRLSVLIMISIAICLDAARGDEAERAVSAEERAIAFLVREVPRWSSENHCFSCHNNGDGARALFEASRRGDRVPDVALAETTRWLARPEGWDHNGGEGPFSDKRLARIQFSSALVEAFAAGKVNDRAILLRAAERLARDQAKDGSWPLEGGDSLGSPTTLGVPLATLSAREVLQAADPARFREAVDRADRWFLRRKPANLFEAAATLTAAAALKGSDAVALRRRCLDMIRQGRSDDGGWGPYVEAPPEAFDTAVVLLALARVRQDEAGLDAMIDKGRAYLISIQNDDGSWTETTRPSGAELRAADFDDRLGDAGTLGRSAEVIPIQDVRFKIQDSRDHVEKTVAYAGRRRFRRGFSSARCAYETAGWFVRRVPRGDRPETRRLRTVGRCCCRRDLQDRDRRRLGIRRDSKRVGDERPGSRGRFDSARPATARPS